MEQEYPYRLGAVAVIVNKQKQFLVVNVMGYKAGEFDFVGGGREGNETPEENMFREVQEEIGLTQDFFRIIGQSKHQIKFDFRNPIEFQTAEGERVMYKGQIKDALVLEFLGNDEDIKVAEDQVREYKWINAGELPDHLLFRGQLQDALAIIGEIIPDYLEGDDELKVK